MNYANPYFPVGLHASVQTTHLQRRTAIELSQAADAAPTVTFKRLINERTVLLDDGRRVYLRFLQRPQKEKRPSRKRINLITKALRGISAKLVNVRIVGTGIQGDLAFEITHPALLPQLGLPDQQVLASIVENYVSLGMALVGFGFAEIDADTKTTDRIAQHHLRLLRAIQADAQTARTGMWAAPGLSAALLRKLVSP